MALRKRIHSLAPRAAKLWISSLRDAETSIPHFNPAPLKGNSLPLKNFLGGPSLSSILSQESRALRSKLGAISPRRGLLYDGGSRSYYVDRYQVRHFRQRGPRRWFENPRVVFLVVVVGGGVLITVYFGNLETVPYTHRRHFVLMSRSIERKIGENQFEQLKASLKRKILPPLHPDSIRVRLIAKDIINALQRGIRHERVWSDLKYSAEPLEVTDSLGSHTPVITLSGEQEKLDIGWHKEDEVLDDSWVQQNRKMSKAQGSQPATQHLEGLNWEVIVVDEPAVNAFCLPGGKIVVFTGLLNHFKSDAEIATVIGHEVGHAIARHAAEGITKNLWFAIIQLIVLQFISMPDLVNAVSNLLLRLPFSRGMEMEADYIGLLLLASAGYDPRVAPRVYEKLGQLTGESALRDYLSTHPSGRKRAELLRQAKVMEEALGIYREAIAGHGVEGFL
ncbi:Mitochondrial metalloendopeptidase [Nymphaea thermarum]|nr:Mitochondrial metalloendopeptidase [Nymphaea thermarum]